ncbi:acidic leucine-rich nuclear phosphoprotein 32-related protein 2-like [Penaeus chinensis]|uniref:acidic leucine-rich nuclear phosphoprotein 32-related protein 2-like n=1 Tax=Penaeus chinensis TaxID=139456 RepID=UPI001FB7497A|nr:acidic leucine-rich nuclear phosphoprotein 32-related protein 2-like [Penaeus chinensis]
MACGIKRGSQGVSPKVSDKVGGYIINIRVVPRPRANLDAGGTSSQISMNTEPSISMYGRLGSKSGPHGHGDKGEGEEESKDEIKDKGEDEEESKDEIKDKGEDEEESKDEIKDKGEDEEESKDEIKDKGEDEEESKDEIKDKDEDETKGEI